MKRIIIVTLAVLALSVTPAFGNGNGGNGPHHNDHSHHNDNSETTITIDKSKTKVEGSTSIEEGDDNPRQTPPASAPGLTASEEACMGSTSFGASSAFGGVSFGTTWKNIDCERRKYAMLLRHFGYPEAALSLLALNPDVAAVLKATNVPFAVVNVPESTPKSETRESDPDNSYMDHDYEVE